MSRRLIRHPGKNVEYFLLRLDFSAKKYNESEFLYNAWKIHRVTNVYFNKKKDNVISETSLEYLKEVTLNMILCNNLI